MVCHKSKNKCKMLTVNFTLFNIILPLIFFSNWCYIVQDGKISSFFSLNNDRCIRFSHLFICPKKKSRLILLTFTTKTKKNHLILCLITLKIIILYVRSFQNNSIFHNFLIMISTGVAVFELWKKNVMEEWLKKRQFNCHMVIFRFC